MTKDDQRAARLAAALRANLRRRKAPGRVLAEERRAASAVPAGTPSGHRHETD